MTPEMNKFLKALLEALSQEQDDLAAESHTIQSVLAIQSVRMAILNAQSRILIEEMKDND